MKKIFFCFSILILFSFLHKKNIILTTKESCNKIDGFLIYKMQIKDAEFIQRNKELKKKGKNYSISIDYSLETYFIPMDSLVSQSLENILLNYNRQCGNAIYQTDISHNEVDIRVYCDSSFKLENDIPVYCNTSWKKLEGDNQYLYKIRYLKGDFKYCKLENNKIHRSFMNISCLSYPKLEYLNCYFLINVDSINCNVNIDKFKTWN